MSDCIDGEEIPDFADPDPVKRLGWARMIIELHDEKSKLVTERQKRLAGLGLPKPQLKHYDTQLLALRNSRRRWENYITNGCPRDSRAPGIRKISQYV